jgi:hypothetical protein
MLVTIKFKTMKHGDQINTNIFLRNNTPLDDFLGLTPAEVQYLIYEPLSDKSPVRYSEGIDNKTLDGIPVFRIIEEYLKIIKRDMHIKLTPLGALPKKIMVELYNKKILTDENIESGIVKLWKEQDCIAIMSARLATEFAGLVRWIFQ